MSDDQYLQMFFDEAEEYIQMLNENILDLENNPENKETINSLFRAAHSLKGMAATMGFDTLTELTHKLENLMDKVRSEELKADTELVDLLFAGIDLIERIVEQIGETGEENMDISEYIEEIDVYLENGRQKQEAEKENDQPAGSDDEKSEKIEAEDVEEQIAKVEGIDLELTHEEKNSLRENKKESDIVYLIKVQLDEETKFKNARSSMVLKNASELGYLIKSAPTREEVEEVDLEDGKIAIILVSNLAEPEIREELIDINDVKEVEIKEINIYKSKEETTESRETETSRTKKEKNSSSSKSQNKSGSSDGVSSNFKVSSTVRVDINKLDTLMNMIGELLINKTRLQSLDIDNDDYKEVLPQLDRVTMELHHTVMQIRMEPVGVMFNRFPRMIRDLSKEEGKEIDFVMEGEDTELDRSIIDELGDPMTHLLRNAVDHGIEKPEIRAEKGKDKEGTIHLRAYQSGSEIIIEVEDDGGGIDREELVKKAISKNVISREEAEDMDSDEKLELIFRPGLSTSDEVSDVSGRGVGMDVVKNTVESLDGEVIIESEKDKGTKFTISLPLTLAITEALMVEINNEIFAIPLNNIQETLMISSDEIKKVKGKDVISLRNQTIPLLDSRESLNLDTEYGLYRNQDEIAAVLIQTGGKQFGLIVDKLLQQQEIVIKSLGNYLDNVENISGATIIGDGEVALILDVRNIA
ncbi:MAG: chemotaxis protein CheW [Halanaerobiales bacterium]